MRTISMLALLVVFVGCSTQEPNTTESKDNKTLSAQVTNADDFKIIIEKGPTLDAGPNTFIGDPSVKDDVSLLSWLGGKTKIDKIIVGAPYINVNQQQFSEIYVRERIEKSVCVNSRAKAWHYAPYTMGTIYLKNGEKMNFTMYLSGIKVGNILFALP